MYVQCYTHGCGLRILSDCFLLFAVQSLLGAVRQVQSSLETEQEKLASLERNLSGAAEDPITIPASSEQAVSEEWLQSLKGRRDVSI